ncbi:MAG: hypothetical protein HKM98_10855 [Gammaproteobacteria bacterium]|nr:hypothetical protein [Gammaproteobacteria bacterium]
MRIKFRFCWVFLALWVTGPVIADDHKAPDMVDSWVMVVKDGHTENFEKALKEHLKYRAKKGDTRVWKTYEPIIGDDLNHYVIRHCCSTYAAMDDYRNWTQKSKTGDHWNDNVDEHVAEYRHHLIRVDMKNSHWPEDDSSYELFGVTTWDAKSGRAAAISSSKAALSEAAKSGDWPRYWSWSTQITGEGGLMLVSPYSNYADMETPGDGFAAFLAEQVGQEKAGMMLSSFSENFHGSEFSVYRLNRELSMKE